MMEKITQFLGRPTPGGRAALPPGVNFTNIFVCLFWAIRMRTRFFGVNSERVCLTAQRFGKQQTNFRSQISHNVVANFCGSVDRMLMKSNNKFFDKCCASATFRLAKKVWWNRPLMCYGSLNSKCLYLSQRSKRTFINDVTMICNTLSPRVF